MNKKNIFRLAKDPKFISGIYNYCDRWCERCVFTSRCLTYELDAEDNNNPATHDINNEAFWNHLQSIFEQTIEMITEIANEMGIDLSSLDIESASDDLSLQMDKTDDYEIIRAARNYGKMVDQWFDLKYQVFEQKQDGMNILLEIGIEKADMHKNAASIKDALEVIRWYQHLIYVKLKRAFIHDDLDEEENLVLQSDAEGSVKVSLIGMDRSIGAWGTLQEKFPEETDSILDILIHLDRLRRAAESLFPRARNFKRPGFDDVNN